MYYSKKTYGFDRGFSCCFRQWRSTHSHCSKLHGYALSFEIQFCSHFLDSRNWVVDFGTMDNLKNTLHYWFDHTTLIARDDPDLNTFVSLGEKGIIDLRILDHVGCEQTAKFVYNLAEQWLQKDYPLKEDHDIYVDYVIVSEHPGNSAKYSRG